MSDAAPLQVTSLNGVKVYNCSAGRTSVEWYDEAKSNRTANLRKNQAFRNRIEIIQGFEMPAASGKVKLSKDGRFIIASGVYPPRIRVYELDQLSMKFERFLDAEVVQFQTLTDDWSKMAVLRNDRTIEIHAAFGGYHKTRVPKFGRDIAYHYPSCDLYVAGDGNEVYRLNLEQGRYLAPLQTQRAGINVCGFNPVHNLLGLGGDDGVLECWDPRDRSAVASLNIAMTASSLNARLGSQLLESKPSITAMRFDDDGLTMGVGLDTGHVLLYDLRSSRPMLSKDHRYELPVHTIKFHPHAGRRLVVSSDPKSIKLWDAKTGEPFTSIQPPADLNHVALVGDSGMIIAAGESKKINVFYVPQLGSAPKWSSFLDSLTEELEESTEATVYDDYKFVTREQLQDWGLENMIGSNLLRAYMHGFFMDIRLYNRVREAADPQAYDKFVAQKIQREIEKRREGRITLAKRLPQVNKMYAKLLLEKPKVKRKIRELQEEAQVAHGSDSEPDSAGDEAALQAAEETVVSNPIGDSRFGKLFSNPDFEIDGASMEYQRLHPRAVNDDGEVDAKFARRKMKQRMDESDSDQEDDDRVMQRLATRAATPPPSPPPPPRRKEPKMGMKEISHSGNWMEASKATPADEADKQNKRFVKKQSVGDRIKQKRREKRRSQYELEGAADADAKKKGYKKKKQDSKVRRSMKGLL